MANDNGGDGERGIILPFATREEQAKKRAGEISATEEELRNFNAKAVKMLEQLRADRRITRDLVESYAEQLKTALDNPEVNSAQLTPWIGVYRYKEKLAVILRNRFSLLRETRHCTDGRRDSRTNPRPT